MDFDAFGYRSRNGMFGSDGSYVFNFYKDWTNLRFHQQWIIKGSLP
jgi:hypothetical protein